MKNLSRWALAAFAVLCIGGLLETPAHAQMPLPSQVYSLFNCSVDNVAATLTKVCSAQADATTTMYVTNVVAQSTTSTAGTFLLETGTGTNCGTGTTSFFPSAASVARIGSAANTAAPTVIALTTPLRVPPGKDLCLLGVATNTTTAVIAGYVAPQ